MPRKLVVLYDGTWNTTKTRTNVAHLGQLLAPQSSDGAEQLAFYDKGVGTQALTRLSGGIFGYGLSDNVRDGYAWLASHYRPGDEIFVFGFSRGAYTARSLVGLIRKCGILRTTESELVVQAYDLYRDKDSAPDSPDATAFRTRFAQEARVKFIGVWDTVGSLGIPVSGVPFSRDYYQWHDTELSKIVDYAYHALAIDEHRKDFAPALWTGRKPENKEVEQRWFIGSHSNVGGGHHGDPLPHLAFGWMQGKAKDCGLAFNSELLPSPQDHLAPIHDSYSDFAYGLYKLLKRGKRYYRLCGAGVNETVDESVWKRWTAQPAYRPSTVAAKQP